MDAPAIRRPAWLLFPLYLLPAWDAGARSLPPISEIAQKAIPSVVSISSMRKEVGQVGKGALGLGSGVVLEPDGLIVTSHHVIEGATRITVTLGSGSQALPARLVAGDSRADIALIRLESPPKPPLQALAFGDSDRVRVGDPVVAVGNPFGFRHSVTSGIVSGRGRSGASVASLAGTTAESGPDVEELIQTDAAINPGNSGGPLLNSRGEMVGLNAAIFSQTGGFMGIGFAIPSKTVRLITEELLRNGRIVRGWIGVSAQNLDPELAGLFGSTEATGALLSDIRPDGPAQKAELRPGDILLSFDGTRIPDALALKRAVNRSTVGKKVRLELMRSGKKQEVELVIQEVPAAPRPNLQAVPQPSPSPSTLLARSSRDLGLSFQAVPPDLRDLMLLPRKTGVLITQVAPESPAAAAGLSTGDVILSLNQRAPESPDSLQSSFKELLGQKKSGPLLLLVQRGPGDRIFVALPVEIPAGRAAAG